jgi:hypothetical protein
VLHPARDLPAHRTRARGVRRGASSLPAHENRAPPERPVLNEVTTNFNERVLHVLLNIEEYKTKLATLMTELKANTTNVPTFSCMVDDNDNEALNDDELVFAKHVCDRQVWDDQPPKKMGLYHAFVRPHTKDIIEYKLFIVLSGSLPFLDEAHEDLLDQLL